MRFGHVSTDPAAGLDAGDEGRYQRTAARAVALAERQNSGQHGDRGMAEKGEMHVVVVEGMGSRAVDERCLSDAGAYAGADDRCLR